MRDLLAERIQRRIAQAREEAVRMRAELCEDDMNKVPTIAAIAACALLLEEATAAAHVHEVGGNNLGPEVEWYQKTTGGTPGESWCDDFQFAEFLKAYCQLSGFLTGKTDAENRAIMLQHADAFSRLYHFPRTGSCQATADGAKKQGRFHGPDFTPSPGDLVLFDFPVKGKRLGRAHHIEMVRRVLSAHEIEDIGANTSSGVAGSQADGDGVFIRTRPTTYVYGYVHFS